MSILSAFSIVLGSLLTVWAACAIVVYWKQVLIAAGALCCLGVVLYTFAWYQRDIGAFVWKTYQANTLPAWERDDLSEFNRMISTMSLEECLTLLRTIYSNPSSSAYWISRAREILIKNGTDTDRAFFQARPAPEPSASPSASPQPKIKRTQPQTWLVEK